MGLTIFYSGQIRDMQLLPALTEEVMDICDHLNWISKQYYHSPEIPLTGFMFHPPGCEPIWITFREDGFLADPIYYIFKNDPISKPSPEEEFMPYAVTQFAGQDAHMALIKLLRYLSQKYFEEFEIVDESEYWETGDEQLCSDRFDWFTQYMDMESQKLDQLDGRTGESGSTFSERVRHIVSERGWDDLLRVL